MKVTMSERFKKMVDWFSINYDKEIAGWITGQVTPEEIIMDDLLIPEQEADKGGIDMSNKQIANLRKEYGNRCASIIGEWHSHNTMGCFWSGTDDSFISEYMKPREVGVFVVSSKGEHLVRLEIRKPIVLSINKMEYGTKSDDTMSVELGEVIKTKVKEPVRSMMSASAYNYGYGWDFDRHAGYSDVSGWRKDLGISKEPSEKSWNKRLGRMVTYHNNNAVAINGISWTVADSLAEIFQHYKPEIVCMSDGASFGVHLKSKEEALGFMKEAKAELRALLEQEAVQDAVSDWEDI